MMQCNAVTITIVVKGRRPNHVFIMIRSYEAVILRIKLINKAINAAGAARNAQVAFRDIGRSDLTKVCGYR